MADKKGFAILGSSLTFWERESWLPHDVFNKSLSRLYVNAIQNGCLNIYVRSRVQDLGPKMTVVF